MGGAMRLWIRILLVSSVVLLGVVGVDDEIRFDVEEVAPNEVGAVEPELGSRLQRELEQERKQSSELKQQHHRHGTIDRTSDAAGVPPPKFHLDSGAGLEEEKEPQQEEKKNGLGGFVDSLIGDRQKVNLTAEAERHELVSTVDGKRERLITLSQRKKEIMALIESRKEKGRLRQKSLNALKDAREQETEIKRQHLDNFQSVRSVLPALMNNLDVLTAEHTQAEEDLRTAKRQYEELSKKFGELQNDLKNMDLETWLRNSPDLSPMMREVLKLTQSTVNPAARSFSKFRSSLETDPMSIHSFALAIMIYLMVLFPMVVVLAVMLQVQKSFTNVSVAHAVMLGSLYFGLLASLCSFFTAGLWRDLLLVLHDQHPYAFDLFLLLQTLLYWGTTFCQIRVFFETKTSMMGFVQCTALITAGIHFTVTLPGKLTNEAANPASALLYYIIYAFFFFFLAIEKDRVSSIPLKKNRMSRSLNDIVKEFGIPAPTNIVLVQLLLWSKMYYARFRKI